MARKRKPKVPKKRSTEEVSDLRAIEEVEPDKFLEEKKQFVLARESEVRNSEKYLEGISVRDFVRFYEKFYFLVTNSEPEWGYDMVMWRDDERALKKIAAEEGGNLAVLLEDELPEMIYRWCYRTFRVDLENRAVNLHAYDQLTEFGQQLLKENSYIFKQWYKKLYQTTHIEEEKKVQLERSLLNFTKYPPDDLHPDILVDEEKFDWLVERAALKELQELLANRLMRTEKQLKKSDKIWPSDNMWWKRSSVIQDRCSQYKYFEPLLVVLNKLRLGFQKSKDLSIKHKIQPPEKGKVWALINHEEIETDLHIAEIPSKTYEKYRAAFFKSGIFQKVHKIQNGPAIIAIGTYNDTHNRQRVSRFLKAKTTGRVSDFKLGER